MWMSKSGKLTELEGHAAIARALADHGVEVVFGLVGDANLFIVHSLVGDEGIRFVAATHEATAVLMADGYARVTGTLGVATVTHGPGLTNTVTALVEATRARTPMLLIAGDTPAEARQNLQDVDQHRIIEACGAGVHQVRSSSTMVEDVAIAIRRAHDERGPVVLNLPVEYEWETVTYERVVSPPVRQSVSPDHDALDAAVGVLASAKRPVVLAGRGAIGARDQILALAERLGAPVATTLLAKGLFTGAPFDLGVMGTLSTPDSAAIISDADVIVAFGAALNRYTTSNGTFASDVAIVQVDRDPAALGRWEGLAAGVVGDAGATAQLMHDWLDQAEVPPSSFRSSAVVGVMGTVAAEDHFVDRSTDTTVDLRSAAVRLEQMLPANRTIATDAGRFIYQTLPYLSLPEAGCFAGGLAFGSIGLGMGLAIGAGVGRPDRPVVGLFGDGGFMLGGLTEFSTAVREGIDLIAVVANDSSYGAEHVQLHRKGLDPSLSMFEWPDLASVAESLGGRGITVHDLADLEAVREAIATRDRPLLIDLRADPAVLSEES